MTRADGFLPTRSPPATVAGAGHRWGENEGSVSMPSDSSPAASATPSAAPAWVRVLLPCLALAGLLPACQAIAAIFVGSAAVVGAAGYGVYKTGEYAVTGVGTAAKATGSAISSGTKSAVSVVFVNGDFERECAGDVPTVWEASRRAFQRAGFSGTDGNYDALTGKLTAKTRDDTDLKLELERIDGKGTLMRIRVGVAGDLKTSELIHGMIVKELPASPLSAAPPPLANEVRS